MKFIKGSIRFLHQTIMTTFIQHQRNYSRNFSLLQNVIVPTVHILPMIFCFFYRNFMFTCITALFSKSSHKKNTSTACHRRQLFNSPFKMDIKTKSIVEQLCYQKKYKQVNLNEFLKVRVSRGPAHIHYTSRFYSSF